MWVPPWARRMWAPSWAWGKRVPRWAQEMGVPPWLRGMRAPLWARGMRALSRAGLKRAPPWAQPGHTGTTTGTRAQSREQGLWEGFGHGPPSCTHGLCAPGRGEVAPTFSGDVENQTGGYAGTAVPWRRGGDAGPCRSGGRCRGGAAVAGGVWQGCAAGAAPRLRGGVPRRAHPRGSGAGLGPRLRGGAHLGAELPQRVAGNGRPRVRAPRLAPAPPAGGTGAVGAGGAGAAAGRDGHRRPGERHLQGGAGGAGAAHGAQPGPAQGLHRQRDAAGAGADGPALPRLPAPLPGLRVERGQPGGAAAEPGHPHPERGAGDRQLLPGALHLHERAGVRRGDGPAPAPLERHLPLPLPRPTNHVPQVEDVQGPEAPTAGRDPAEQLNLEGLVPAVCGGDEESRLQLRDAAGGQGQAGTLWSVRWRRWRASTWKDLIQAVTWEYHKWRMYSCTQVRKMKDKPAALPSWVQAPCLHPCSLSEGLPSPSLASPTGSPSSTGF
ncbi:protein phosphatase Slingshot homolog 3 isoform X2 [Accipiter gentilis]|uniref:protein phosphatase Slingshot homolog 3 isoform X2 n=1 Tax=Astur gentilis TaxID=8957 RepID=UPI0021105E43|nr:protein phosphatase Slingshot homolog 3 isoform X2 [Accipiter gentilis]